MNSAIFSTCHQTLINCRKQKHRALEYNIPHGRGIEVFPRVEFDVVFYGATINAGEEKPTSSRHNA